MREKVLDTLETVTGWAVLGNDTVNLATTVRHFHGTTAMEFDKANGAANTVFAGAARTLTSTLNIWDGSEHYTSQAEIRWQLYVSSIANVSYAFIRLGTDASHYVEYRYYDRDIIAGRFTTCRSHLAQFASQTGDGCNFAAIAYMVVGVAFDAETDTLADIAVQRIEIVEAPAVNATIVNSDSDNMATADSPAPTVTGVMGGIANAAAPTRVEAMTAQFSMDLKGGVRTKIDLAQVAKGGDSPADIVQVGGISTTAAPSYTTAKANALSLTTGGALRARIDTAQTTIGGDAAADIVQVGTATTTAAPTYTTAKQNPISTNTAGSVRVAVDKAQTTNGGDVTTDGLMQGALANATAPTIVEGKMGFASSDLKGGLRVRADLAQGAQAGTDPTQRVITGAIACSTVPTAVTTGQIVTPFVDTIGREVGPAHDLGSGTTLTTPVSEAPRKAYGPSTVTALAAAGSTTAVNCIDYGSITWSFVVASLEAGQFIVVRAEAMDDGTNYHNMAASGTDTTINANGNYALRASGRSNLKTRLTLVTDSVGGAVTVTPTLTMGR